MMLPEDLLASLQACQRALASTNLVSLFAEDADRAENFSATAGDVTLDFSRHLVDRATLDLLVQGLESRGFQAKRNALLCGEHINNTEQRAALHTALRARVNDMPAQLREEIVACRERQARAADAIRNNEWCGHTGKPFRSIVNIGIGGSDLGPHMATRALLPIGGEREFHFVSNVDPADIAAVLSRCHPEETLFIISSKTFTTFETLKNASHAREWLVGHFNDPAATRKHFLAVSSNVPRAVEFGIHADNVFPMWDWVGGRYSLWSAIGIPVRIAIGNEGFDAMLEGAATIDRHFVEAPLQRNVPVLMALLGVWYRNFWSAQSHGVICYEQRLEFFAAYLQQLEMESNGKGVDALGNPVNFDTGAVLWGGVGTNTQHSFHQLLHQGTTLVPIDFMVGLVSPDPIDDQHRYLFANCIAQSHALMAGLEARDSEAQMRAAGMSEAEARRLAPHRQMPGNRPHSMLVYPKLTPSVLGQLIALYEHKVFCQAVFWGINPFDQYGVELGKTIGLQVAEALSPSTDENSRPRFDPASDKLVAMFRRANGA